MTATIRKMAAQDVDALIRRFTFSWSTLQETHDKWQRYFKEQKDGLRIVGVVEEDGVLVGYGSLLLRSEYPHFANIPEIHDVWVHHEQRRKGIARGLIAWLELLAKEMGYNEIGIGVGLYPDYGAAQRLYVQLGYTPDSNGVTYSNQPVVPGSSYPMDDELVLWLKKSLGR